MSEEKNVTDLSKELEELNDRFLRKCAELENLKKRSLKDVAEARNNGIKSFSLEVLGLIDNLNRTANCQCEDIGVLQDGVAMVLKSWDDISKKFKIEKIDVVGQMFDPHTSEALSSVDSDKPEGEVIAEHLPGYLLDGKLMRPAQVVVSGGSEIVA